MNNNIDCCITKDNRWFRYRTGAFIIENDSVLFVGNNAIDYLYTVGGGVHIGETAEECIKREVYEETGIEYEVERLAVICENFFEGKDGKIRGLKCHCLELYFIMKSRGITELKSNSYNDENEKEQLHWIPIKEIKKHNIKPEFLQERIEEIINSEKIIHIVNS